jgi:exosome complex component RRP41
VSDLRLLFTLLSCAVACQSRELISPEGLRADGRRAHELRRVEVRLGALAWSGGAGGGGAAATSVDGAAYFAQGNTKVLAFVVGPRETKLRSQALPDRCSVSCEYSVAPFSFSERKQVSKSDRSEIRNTTTQTGTTLLRFRHQARF